MRLHCFQERSAEQGAKNSLLAGTGSSAADRERDDF
jgi:hypothetical protein